MDTELVVIGNTKAGYDRAISVARRGRNLSVIHPTEKQDRRVISLEIYRRAASELVTGGTIRVSDLRKVVLEIDQAEQSVEYSELERFGVDVYAGAVRFLDRNSVEVNQTETEQGSNVVLKAEKIVLANGTRSLRPAHFPFNNTTVVDRETLLSMPEFPTSMIVVGAGSLGLEYASFLASLGIEVTVVDERTGPIDLCQALTNEKMITDIVSLNMAFRFGDEVIGIDSRSNSSATVRLASGKKFSAGAVLVCVGQEGNTDSLNLEAAGVGVDERGRVWCDQEGKTWNDRIFAVGDIVGFRASTLLAS